jgi:hypothetical protein
MVHFIQQYSPIVVSDDGRPYVARAYAASRPDGRWDGWFVFLPLRAGRSLATDWETTQSTLARVKYWAEAISAVYLQGALRRAWACCPERRFERAAGRAEQEEALAREAAAAYADAAIAARAAAARAKHDRRYAESRLLVERAAAARAAALLQERAASAARAEAAEAKRRLRQFERQVARAGHPSQPATTSARSAHVPHSPHRSRSSSSTPPFAGSHHHE